MVYLAQEERTISGENNSSQREKSQNNHISTVRQEKAIRLIL
jgi:hypothetical protein